MFHLMSRRSVVGGRAATGRRPATLGTLLLALSLIAAARAAPVTDPATAIAGETTTAFRITPVAAQPAAPVIDTALAPSDIGASLSPAEMLDSPALPSDPATPAAELVSRPTLTRESAQALARLLIDPASSPAHQWVEPPSGGPVEGWSRAAAGPSIDRPRASSGYSQAPDIASIGEPGDAPTRDAEWGRAVRPTLEFLRENREWVLTAGVVVALLSLVGGVRWQGGADQRRRPAQQPALSAPPPSAVRAHGRRARRR